VVLELFTGSGEILAALVGGEDVYVVTLGNFVVAEALDDDGGLLFVD